MMQGGSHHRVDLTLPADARSTEAHWAKMAALGATAAVPMGRAVQVHVASAGRVQDTPEYWAKMAALADGRAAPDTPAVPDTQAVPAPAGAAAAEAAIAKAVAAATAEAAKAPETTEAPAESTEADRPAGSDLSQEFLQSAADRVYDAWDAAGELDPGLVAELAAESGRSEQQVRAVAESLVAWRQRMIEIGVI